MSYELTPDCDGLPASTFEGVDVEYFVDSLIRATGIPEDELPSGIGLFGLARLAKPLQISVEARERLEKANPQLLRVLEREQARQQFQYDWDHNRV
ncbi:MAG: hypothetical protein ACXWLH_03525 [Candidatus Saccharimonadales bacterium]